MPAGVPAYVALANITLGSNAATVTFSSISQAYRDLVLVMEYTTTTGTGPVFTFNASSTGYNYVVAQGNGSTTGSYGATGDTYFPFDGNAGSDTSKQSAILNIFDYSVTDKHKSIVFRRNKPNAMVHMMAGRWANTAAITSIELNSFANSGIWATGTTFALYGIAS
jgi:hypothetical protein